MFRIHNTITLDLSRLEAYKRRFRNPKTPEMRTVMNQWRARYLKQIRRRFATNSRGGGDWPGLKPATIFARRHKGQATKAAIGYTSKKNGRLSGMSDVQRKAYKSMLKRTTARLAEQMGSSVENNRVKALARAHVARRVRSLGGQLETRKQIANRLITGGKVSILRDTSTLFAALDISHSNNWRFISDGIRVGFLKSKSQRHPGVKRTLSIADIAGIHQFGKGNAPKRPIIVDPDKQTTDGMIRDLMRATK
ncbi:MAG: hypothetical protein ACF8OB_03035 [Phycisphaeraceae bacterium JB051]